MQIDEIVNFRNLLYFYIENNSEWINKKTGHVQNTSHTSLSRTNAGQPVSQSVITTRLDQMLLDVIPVTLHLSWSRRTSQQKNLMSQVWTLPHTKTTRNLFRNAQCSSYSQMSAAFASPEACSISHRWGFPNFGNVCFENKQTVSNFTMLLNATKTWPCWTSYLFSANC